MPTPTLQFLNNGQDLVQTDFWDSALCRAGKMFLAWNAGAARLLVPDSRVDDLDDMHAADEVIISCGRCEDEDAGETLELMFVDGSHAPYCLYLPSEQTDRMAPESDQGEDFVVAVWTRNGKSLQLQGRYRVVEAIPYLKPWR
jgi:hypothetical protein